MQLKREDVITFPNGKCPVCGGELTVTQDNPEHNSLPIWSTCHNCKMYSDSYHGMGDSAGRLGLYEDSIFSWGWGAWDEQGYLSAILAAREKLENTYKAEITNEDDLFHTNRFIQERLREAKLEIGDTLKVIIRCEIVRR